MCKLAPTSKCETPTLKLPGEAAAGKGLISYAASPLRTPSLHSRWVGIGCDSLWPSRPSTKSQEPSLQGTASPWSYLAAIPPGLVSIRLTQVLSRLRAVELLSVINTCWLQLTTPCGRPGYGPPLPLRPVGADCNRHPGFLSGAEPLPENRPAGYRLRGSLRISIVGEVLIFVGQCQFACTLISRINVSAALTGESTVSAWPQAPSSVFPLIQRQWWAVPAQAGEAVCPPHNAGLCRGLGA